MSIPAQDPRVAAFCSPQGPDVFNSVVVATQIWKEDPFDVESIHQEARDTFNSVLNQAVISQVPGRVLTVIGESGAGKTHLMRYFRNYVHRRDFGYFAYLQLTSPEQDYGRFIVGHLIDSLNQPYDASSDTTGLMRLSNAVAESSKTLRNTAIRSGPRSSTVLAALREWDLTEKDLGKLVGLAIQRIVRDPNFTGIDNNVLATMLYLQAQDPFIKNLVITYLRSQTLAPIYQDAVPALAAMSMGLSPVQVIAQLAKLMWATDQKILVLCIDQLEGALDFENSEHYVNRLLNAVSTLLLVFLPRS